MTTYKDAGVNIKATDSMIKDIASYSKKTSRIGEMTGIGDFAGLFDLKKCGYNDPILVTSTDGVGTKILLGIETKLLEGLGYDLVGMCLNDTLCHGADPLFFLDYYASSQLDRSSFLKVVKSIANACKDNNCLLIGGETAEMPGMYNSKDFDLAGFCVGAVERQKLLPQKNEMREGDILIGVSSSGFHSNGYSLIRKVIKDYKINLNNPTPFESNWKNIGCAIMEPTKQYFSELKPIINQNIIKGIAHITGGGLIGNLPRILPEHLGAKIEYEHLPKLKIFEWFKKISEIPEDEMFKTFNCGVGLVLVINEKNYDTFLNLTKKNKNFYKIGGLIKSDQPNYCVIN